MRRGAASCLPSLGTRVHGKELWVINQVSPPDIWKQHSRKIQPQIVLTSNLQTVNMQQWEKVFLYQWNTLMSGWLSKSFMQLLSLLQILRFMVGKEGELTTNQGTAVPGCLGSTSSSCLTGLILLQLSLDKPLMVPFGGVLETGMEVAPSARNHDLAKQEGTIHPSDEGTDDTYPKTWNMECSLNTDVVIWRERESMEIMYFHNSEKLFHILLQWRGSYALYPSTQLMTFLKKTRTKTKITIPGGMASKRNNLLSWQWWTKRQKSNHFQRVLSKDHNLQQQSLFAEQNPQTCN